MSRGAFRKSSGEDRRDTGVFDLSTGKPPEEILAVAEDAVLLDVEHVDAICKRIEKVPWPLYRKTELVFSFRIVEPTEYNTVTLKMYVQHRAEWKTKPLPRSSSLWKAAAVALGRPVKQRDRIVYSLWLNKLFRCRVRPTKGTSPYSVIDSLETRLA